MTERGRLVGPSATNSIQLSQDQLGAPGTHGSFTVVPLFKGEESADELRLTDTEEWEFTCTIQLAKQVSSERSINGSFTARDSGSFLSPPGGTVALAVNTNHGDFHIESNEKAELSLVSMTLGATSLAKAASAFHAVVTPLLDYLAYAANVPVRAGATKVHDRKNDVQRIYLVNPFGQMIISNHIGEIRAELGPVNALYREARNSESLYYQLLCFYKIMEGLSRLKGRVVKQIRKRGLQVDVADDLVPEHPDLADDLGQHAGKSVKRFQDMVLTRRCRDAVAHFELSNSSVLHVSSPAEFARFADAAFAGELCARVMIENYNALAQAVNPPLPGGSPPGARPASRRTPAARRGP